MRLLATISLLAFCSVSRAGGPWVPAYQKGFVQVGFSGLYYNAVFGPDGSERAVFRNTSDVTLQLYAEYGFARRWEVRAVLPYKILRTGLSTNASANPVPAGTLSGVGNIGLGVKRAVLDGNVKLSAGVDVLANTFVNNDRLGLRTGYEGWTVLPYLSLGSSGNRTYYYAEAGYGLMTQEYSNFLKLAGELGYRLHPRLWVAGTLDFRLSTRNGRFANSEAYQFTAAYLNDQLFLGTGIKASFELIPNRLGINASAIGAVAGENVPFSRSYNTGLFFKW
ncbi:hypothetical protein [Spirosoma montaniterrae]|uniref:Transporter n=1 Tax=Spirosoma montaniterrae TaxID=1178516 RepID=A0A1P9WSI2_9BACT|nr:hypothetical protein [Spirosoma montaniterrae]AQG78293.1 hypothetical protein AWR27_02420 [Spirosoma montaniterrae]